MIFFYRKVRLNESSASDIESPTRLRIPYELEVAVEIREVELLLGVVLGIGTRWIL